MTETSIAHGMKDWPRPLKLNAVVCDLAKTIYYAQAEVYGGHVHWYGLSEATKADYVSKAANVIQGCAPVTRDGLFEQATAVARQEAARVLGRIDPQTPWGRTDDPMEGGK